ncbi:MAG TPA: hypothetical protein VH951_00700, partial [Dehalococcoidia bacterium]
MDIVLAGSGSPLRQCGELLRTAGFVVGHDPDGDERCPVILGDVPHLFAQALQLIQAGRHLLIANPLALSAPQLASLLAARRGRQALFVWSERRQHPAFRLVSGLIRSDDGAWRPRYLRQSAFCAERPTAASLHWRTAEALTILLDLAGGEPLRLAAQRSVSP